MSVLIQFKNVTKYYYLGDVALNVLHDVTLSVQPGEFIAIGHRGQANPHLSVLVFGPAVVANRCRYRRDNSDRPTCRLVPTRRAAKLDSVEALRYE